MGAREAATLPDDISLLELYRRMVLVREFDRLRRDLWLQRRLRGDLYLSLGQEATAVGLASALAREDRLFASRRGASLEIARGRCLTRALREDLQPASCRRAELATPAGHLPLAVGAALAARLDGERAVVLVECGDGATGDGLFHESLMMSRLWSVPVVFACVNNQLSGERPAGKDALLPSVAARAAAYDIPSWRVDGQDARAVFEAARRAITQAREGGGPVLIECVTYRIAEHVLRHDAPVECARGEERDFWQNRDPVRRFRALLTRDRLAHAETLAVIDHAARADVDAAARALFGSPDGGSNAGMALMPLHRAASPWN